MSLEKVELETNEMQFAERNVVEANIKRKDF